MHLTKATVKDYLEPTTECRPCKFQDQGAYQEIQQADKLSSSLLFLLLF